MNMNSGHIHVVGAEFHEFTADGVGFVSHVRKFVSHRGRCA